MANKKTAGKAKGAKSLSADKASQIKGGIASIPTSNATFKFVGDGSVKTISSVKTVEWK